MIREGKYIIRRILIGVGIVLVLGFLNGCKVKALSWSDSNMHEVSSLHSGSANIDYKIYFNSSLNRYYFYTSDSPNNYNRYRDNANELPYVACLWNSANSNSFHCVFSSVPLYLYKTGNIYNRLVASNLSSYTKVWPVQLITNSSSGYSPGTILNYNLESFTSDSPIENPNVANNLRSCNYDVHYYTSGNLFLRATSNYIPPSSSVPSFVSWNYTKNTSNNVITGYTFNPEFSNFDTDNYTYYYKFGNSNWLTLTENEQNININSNGTIYVKIVENSSSDIIDSATFTITDLGTFNNEQNYNITFSGEYRTENYLNNNISSKSQSIIQEYQIYINYSPKSSILKYQYQYVNTGDSLDANSWQTLSSADNGSFTYVATENGTLYARILDQEDNNLFSATFTVNSIGLLAFDNNEEEINNFFTKLSNKISYGGPISNLFRIPIDILNRIYSYSSYTCSPYKISTLLGTDIVLPCYNFKNIFGNTIYTLFDSLLCFILSLCLFKFVRNIYDKFINMDNISS